MQADLEMLASPATMPKRADAGRAVGGIPQRGQSA